jgi:hypothetical protein
VRNIVYKLGTITDAMNGGNFGQVLVFRFTNSAIINHGNYYCVPVMNLFCDYICSIKTGLVTFEDF